MKAPSPALFGATRIRSVPSIGLRRHRPWAELNGKGSKRGAPLLALLALTGCAHTTHLYTPVYCISQDQYTKLKSAEPEKIGSKLTGKAQDDLKLIAGNDVELRRYSDDLLGVVGGCVDPTTEAPAKSR
jgi:hypothetical protein